MSQAVQQTFFGAYGGLALALLLSLLGITADTLLKAASQQPQPFLNLWFALGALATIAFAIGWVFLMQLMKLGTAGVLYAVTSSLLLVAIGYLVFGERLSTSEVTGVAMAVGSFVLLGRLI
jgi:drug/metabolite transporter (DMT)-like permease